LGGKCKERILHLMKLYTWLFILTTLAQIVFSLTWLLFTKKMDGVLLLSALIYAGVMIAGYISYEVEKYRKRKRELMDDLP
jgi:hypothetical protein